MVIKKRCQEEIKRIRLLRWIVADIEADAFRVQLAFRFDWPASGGRLLLVVCSIKVPLS